MTRQVFLFFIIFLEGYIVLSTELLALRLIIPFVGNATDTASIIIAAVLMPLAFGYYAGGIARPPYRRKLLINLCLAGLILTFGLSYPLLKIFFEFWEFTPTAAGRLLATGTYALAFLTVPVFLLGQTVPLISHYLKSYNFSQTAGRILFFSTLGSFAGAIICTLVLMPTIGVHHSADITIACIALLTFMLSPRRLWGYSVMIACVLALSLISNSNHIMQRMGIVANNQYNTVQIAYTKDLSKKFMKINHTMASAIYTDPEQRQKSVFPIISHVEKNFIDPALPSAKVLDILVIGGGGLTLGLKDRKNKYTFLDIDPALEDIAPVFLDHRLPPNKKFVAEEARAYLPRAGKKFDLIFLDIYQDVTGVPAHTVTQEFWLDVKSVLKPEGIVTANIVTTPNFSDAYAIRLDQTIRSVFPLVNRQIIHSYDAWDKNPGRFANILYVMYEAPEPASGLYTDNLNRSYLDKGRKFKQGSDYITQP